VFALEVRGDSMIEDHICSGDLVLVEKANQAKDGDIVLPDRRHANYVEAIL
jgi:repressor LexA